MKYLFLMLFLVGCSTSDKVNVPQDCDTVRNSDNSVTLVCHHRLLIQQGRK